MNDKERPAEPVVGDEGTAQGGFAMAAKHLNTLFPVRQRPISRQLVHKWWLFRHFNGFPETIATSGTGTGRPVFDLNAIATWYTSYRRHRGARSCQEPAKNVTATTSSPPSADGDTMAA